MFDWRLLGDESPSVVLYKPPHAGIRFPLEVKLRLLCNSLLKNTKRNAHTFSTSPPIVVLKFYVLKTDESLINILLAVQQSDRVFAISFDPWC